jgi:hypothetical protein
MGRNFFNLGFDKSGLIQLSRESERRLEVAPEVGL